MIKILYEKENISIPNVTFVTIKCSSGYNISVWREKNGQRKRQKNMKKIPQTSNTHIYINILWDTNDMKGIRSFTPYTN